MTVTYPIVALGEGEVLDPDWIADITEAVNDHQDRLSSLESPEWLDYTCTWSASTTNPTITGVVYSRYYYVNQKQVMVVVRFELAAGASKGSGNYSFNLPVAAVSITGKGATGSWIMNDSGSAIRSGFMTIETTATTAKPFVAGGGQLNSATLAGVFTTSWLQWTLTYEVA